MNVLIVEDDPNLRALWRAVLGSLDYYVQEAETVPAARTALRMARYDLILLDLYLGEESGLSLVNDVVQSSPDCKIVIVTGSALFKNGALKAAAPAVATVLRKPVDVEDLIAVCQSIAPADQQTARQL